MSEESEVDRKLREYHERKGDLKEIKIKVNTEEIEDHLEKNVKEKLSLEEQLENERTLREDYEAKLRLIGEQKMAQERKELRNLGYEGELDNVDQIKKGWEKLGGKGNVGLTREQLLKERGSSEKEGYDSIESMIDDLRQKGDNETIQKLWQTHNRLAKQNPNMVLNQGYDENDTEKNPELKTCVEKTKEAQNRAWRKAHGHKEED